MEFSKFINKKEQKINQESLTEVRESWKQNRLEYIYQCTDYTLRALQMFSAMFLFVRLQKKFYPTKNILFLCSPMLQAIISLGYLGSKLNQTVLKREGFLFQGSLKNKRSNEQMDKILKRHRKKFYKDSQYWH